MALPRDCVRFVHHQDIQSPSPRVAVMNSLPHRCQLQMIILITFIDFDVFCKQVLTNFYLVINSQAINFSLNYVDGKWKFVIFHVLWINHFSYSSDKSQNSVIKALWKVTGGGWAVNQRGEALKHWGKTLKHWRKL